MKQYYLLCSSVHSLCMEKCVSASSSSPSPEIKDGVESAESTPQEGFFSPLIQSHTPWMNPICVDALSCSMATLCFTATPALCFCCHCCGRFLHHHHTSTSLQHAKAQLISVAQMPRQQLGDPEVMEMILGQLKDHFCDLMMDQHCVFSILAIFQASSVRHITRILHLLIQNHHKLKEVCMHNHGYCYKFLSHQLWVPCFESEFLVTAGVWWSRSCWSIWRVRSRYVGLYSLWSGSVWDCVRALMVGTSLTTASNFSRLRLQE